jgi:hypothetical protein
MGNGSVNDGAAEVFDLHDVEFITKDTMVMYDKPYHVMRVGSLYPNMK